MEFIARLVLIMLFFTGFFWLISIADGYDERLCKETFGQEYVSRGGNEPDCVNQKTGEGKWY